MDSGHQGRWANAGNLLSQSARFLLSPEQTGALIDEVETAAAIQQGLAVTVYALDNNAAIAVMKGDPRVRKRLNHARGRQHGGVLSSIVLFELQYGAAKNSRTKEPAASLRLLLQISREVLPFDDEDATAAGTIRATLEKAGTPIAPYDLLIAGHALRRGHVLVSRNAGEIRRVPKLAVENWQKE